MADYLQAPDKQSYQFRPFELPYDQIMRTVQAKTSYWIQGANQIKSAYQAAAGMDVSLDSNRQALQGFVQQANQQITQAAKSDLSQGDNVTTALHIFDPLYSGQTDESQNILGDHAITTRAKAIQQKFQESKTKNGGKEYSSANEQYALQSYYNFVRGQDPKGWKESYNNLKDYIPYYDYKPEIDSAIKGCKPSSVSQTGVNGMYLTTNTASGVSASQLGGCISSTLSDKAMSQIQREGFVRFGNNTKALADAYLPIATQNRLSLAEQRATLAGQLAGNSKLDPAAKQAIQQQLDAYDGQLRNIDNSLNAYHKGDLSYFKNNYEQLAGATYMGEKVSAIANAFQYSVRSNSIKADPVQMMLSGQHFQQGMLSQREKFEVGQMDHEYALKHQLELDKIAAKQGHALINPNRTFTPSVDGSAESTKTAADFHNDMAANQNSLAENDTLLYNYLKNSPHYGELMEGMSDPSKPGSPFHSFVQGLFKGKNKSDLDLPLQQYYDRSQSLHWDNALLKSVQHAVEGSPQALANKNRIQNVVNAVDRGEQVTAQAQDGSQVQLNLSPSDIKDLLLGRNVNGAALSRTTIQNSTPYGSSLTFGAGTQTSTNYTSLKINGKDYILPQSYLDKMANSRDKEVNDYNSTLDSLYGQHYVNQYKYVDLSGTNADNKNPLPVRSSLAAALAPVIGFGANTQEAVKDIAIQGVNGKGVLRFTLHPEKKGAEEDSKVILQQLASSGFTNATKVPNTTSEWEVYVPDYDQSQKVNTVQKIQDFAENLYRIQQQGGNKYPRIEMPQYNGLNIAAIPDINNSSNLIFEISNPSAKDPTVKQYARTAGELRAFLEKVN